MEHGSGRVHLSNFDKGRDFSSYALYSTVDIEKWHSRIGHPSDIIMNNEMSCINGSSITGNSKCTSCPLGKSHKLPFHSQHVKALKSFDLIYADLWTSPIVSTTVKYYLLLVDDYSRYMWNYFLSHKSLCKFAFNLFSSTVERQFE